ncbi:MAG: hypothetical protein COY81_02425 [Candidatus Pacebacteria bacterium CG_4_10_14_0_8_um_filter_43_12]|nr:MAG: hypothetical protein COU66_02965 [Candidatus Pacebacteria bacterium CG10_big_fil_rev_8_21_14_0_10_44_11]PIY79459.1 MAG: hypothetical protein COY81_02425 [Candidatus Pacebacteria bacterium CG_4_10_14_0_8_um_filter_43_12]
MLAKKYKLDLHHQLDFFKTAHRIFTEQFTVYWKLAPTQLFGPQFQVTIAKGTVKTIVERNALKRIIYDLCAPLVVAHPKTQLMIVIVIRRAQALQFVPRLTAELAQLFTTHS